MAKRTIHKVHSSLSLFLSEKIHALALATSASLPSNLQGALSLHLHSPLQRQTYCSSSQELAILFICSSSQIVKLTFRTLRSLKRSSSSTFAHLATLPELCFHLTSTLPSWRCRYPTHLQHVASTFLPPQTSTNSSQSPL